MKKVISIKKGYDKFSSKIKIFRMQYEANKKQICLNLKGMNKYFENVKTQRKINEKSGEKN